MTRRAERFELVHHAGKVLVHHPVPTREQAVRVGGLRHALAHLVAVRQEVAVHDGDGVEVCAENPSGEEAAHARAEHDSGRTMGGHL